MKKSLFSCVLLFFIAFNSYSQLVNLTGADGRPIIVEKSNNLEGSPYFLEEYFTIAVVLNRETLERKAMGRLNLINETFEFKNDVDLLEIPFSNIKTLTIDDTKTGTLWNFVNGSVYKLSNKTLVLELFVGEKISLIKDISFKLSDIQSDGYSQSEAKRKVMESDELYLVFNNQKFNFKRNSKSFISVLPEDQKKKAEDFLKKSKINPKNDPHFIQVLEYLENN
jgi:hypothetical protein